ncbi:MAG: O-methyltransferase, partial [Pseudanabaena sp.]
MDSTATSIPYQLRQNKVVDRYAFVELLELINRFNNISTYK